MADGGQMNANLVRAPGREPASQQARGRSAVGTGIALQDLPMSYGRAAVRTQRHLVAGPRMTANRLVDGAFGPVRHPPHEGQVAALHRSGAAMIGELPG